MTLNAIWFRGRNEFVISKSNEHLALVRRNHRYDFRPKVHDPKFNYHFIRSILKSHNLIAKLPNGGFFVFYFPAM